MTIRLDRRHFLFGSTSALATVGLTSRLARATPTRGGRVVIGLIQEPGELIPFFSGQSGQGLAYLAVEPLFQADARGSYRPVLAAEVPTLANGGISRDFLTVTYKLKPGVTWSDGKPLQGFGLVIGSFIYSGWAAVEIPAAFYDAKRAGQLLDAAGWDVFDPRTVHRRREES